MLEAAGFKVAAEGDGRKFKGLAWLFMGVPTAVW